MLVSSVCMVMAGSVVPLSPAFVVAFLDRVFMLSAYVMICDAIDAACSRHSRSFSVPVVVNGS